MKNVADIYALSPMQQLMLLHAKTSENEQDVLFNQIVYRVSGQLNVEAYRRAWQLMVDRHPALRTMFVWQDGKEPLQVVREQVKLPWAQDDWHELPTAEQEKELDTLLAADRAEGFDLLRPPAMRIKLIKLADEQYWLLWSSHHLIIDRWCIGILFGELKTAYEAYAADVYPALAPAPRYRDYISWLGEQNEEKARAYWQESLQDLAARPLPLQVPTGENVESLGNVKIVLHSETWDVIQRFALENGLTPGTLITAAWAVILGAATGVDDALFGLTVSGRPVELPDIGKTVGCFINNVPLRVTLDSEPSVIAWLQTLQDRQLELQAYQYASPAQIQAWSDIKTFGPLFDTLVVLQAPVDLPMPARLVIKFNRGGMQTGFPISLGAVPGKDSLRLTLTYDRQRAPEQLVKQMASALQHVLQAMPELQAKPLPALRAQARVDAPAEPVITLAERKRVGERPYIPPRTAAELALAQIWAEVLGLPRVGIEDKFFDLGGDSINVMQLFTVIEERMGKRLPISLLFRDPTVAQMAQELGNGLTGLPADSILEPLNQDGTRPPFFYAHGVFGDVLNLTNVAPLLNADQPLYGLQAVGLHPDCEPDRTIEEMASRYIEAIMRIQPSGPYYLGGYCFGGVVAYEIARQLEELGEKTALLAIIEGSAPREYHNKLPFYNRQRLQITRQSAPYWIRGNQEFGGWQLRQRLQKKLGHNNGNVELDNLADFNATRPEIQHRIKEINEEAFKAYVPQPYGGKVTFLRASCMRIKHTLFGKIDPQRGWGTLTNGRVEIRYVDGTHVSILTNPYAADLAAHLTSALQHAQERNFVLATATAGAEQLPD